VSDAPRALLELLLEHHPALLSTEEVIREMALGDDSFVRRDEIDVALRELIGAGLAHRSGAFVFASHAAVCFRQLEAA
jgi:hypothetical protein